jgi:hypothetical protein
MSTQISTQLSTQPLSSEPNSAAAIHAAPDPARILEVGFSFWSSKVLLTAVKLGVFTVLGDRSLTGEELASALNLHPRGIYDFFDALVALGFLDREGDGVEGQYRNGSNRAVFKPDSTRLHWRHFGDV